MTTHFGFSAVASVGDRIPLLAVVIASASAPKLAFFRFCLFQSQPQYQYSKFVSASLSPHAHMHTFLRQLMSASALWQLLYGQPTHSRKVNQPGLTATSVSCVCTTKSEFQHQREQLQFSHSHLLLPHQNYVVFSAYPLHVCTVWFPAQFQLTVSAFGSNVGVTSLCLQHLRSLPCQSASS